MYPQDETMSKLIAYRRGELSQEENGRLQAQLTRDPKLAQDLLDLEAFNDPDEYDNPPDSDIGMAAAWKAIRSEFVQKEPVTSRKQRLLAWKFVTAATVFFMTGFLAAAIIFDLEPRSDKRAPSLEINVPTLHILGGHQVRGEEGLPTVTAPEGAVSFMLILSPADISAHDDYEIIVKSEDGRILWQKRGLVFDHELTATALLEVVTLNSGDYEVTIYGLSTSLGKSQRNELLRESFRVRRPPKRDGT